jgi:hypothetical protein
MPGCQRERRPFREDDRPKQTAGSSSQEKREQLRRQWAIANCRLRGATLVLVRSRQLIWRPQEP